METARASVLLGLQGTLEHHCIDRPATQDMGHERRTDARDCHRQNELEVPGELDGQHDPRHGSAHGRRKERTGPRDHEDARGYVECGEAARHEIREPETEDRTQCNHRCEDPARDAS